MPRADSSYIVFVHLPPIDLVAVLVIVLTETITMIFVTCTCFNFIKLCDTLYILHNYTMQMKKVIN